MVNYCGDIYYHWEKICKKFKIIIAIENVDELVRSRLVSLENCQNFVFYLGSIFGALDKKSIIFLQNYIISYPVTNFLMHLVARCIVYISFLWWNNQGLANKTKDLTKNP